MFALRYARPVVDHPDQGLRPGRGNLHADVLLGGRVLESVFDQVHEHALDLVRVDRDGGRIIRKRHVDPSGLCPELVERPDYNLVELDQRPLRLGGAGLQAAQIEEVSDQVIEPVRSGQYRREQLVPVCLVDRELGTRESACRRRDRHQRCPQIVTH